VIKQLIINNFQSHKDTCLEFDTGVNVIVGQSDTGKSAILRAMRWLIWNRPQGESMRSVWGGKMEVEMFTDDAHFVRSKDKDDEYILGDTHFKAFRTEVPAEISQVLNMNEINLQRQLDRHFLLSETPGEVASHFNKVAGLDNIDSTTQKINSLIREWTDTIKRTEYEISETQQQLTKFDHLQEFEAEVTVLEEMDKKYMDLFLKQSQLYDLVISIGSIEKTIREKQEILALEIPVDELLNLYKALRDKEDKYNALDMDIRNIIKVEDNYERAVERQRSLEDKFNELMPSICPLCGSKLK
jgi:DNA repair protein SbcC/Rad50